MKKLLAACLLLSTSLTGCESQKATSEPFTVNVSEDGKADGEVGVLSAADMERLRQAYATAINAGEATARKLEADIARLEAQHQAKVDEITSLEASIAAREQELNNQYNRNLILCAFFPDPSICLFANYVANDSRMNELKRAKDAAQAARTKLEADLATYRDERAQVLAALTDVRASKQRLEAVLASPMSPGETPEVLVASVPTARAYRRVQVLGQIADLTSEEVRLLTQWRNAAAGLAGALDEALTTLRALDASTRALVDSARQQFMDLLEALITGDPAATAEQFLEQAIAQRTRMMIDTLDWPMQELVRHLVDTRGGSADPEALFGRLIERLSEVAPTRVVTRNSTVEVALLDGVEAVSTLRIDDSFAITRLDLSVEFEHAYPGDLRAWLQNGDDVIELFQGNDFGTTQVRWDESFDLTGAWTSAGTWTLHIVDEASQDEGRLTGWTLSLNE